MVHGCILVIRIRESGLGVDCGLRAYSISEVVYSIAAPGVPGYAISRSGVACCMCLSNVRWRSRLRSKSFKVTWCICLSNVRWRSRLRIKSAHVFKKSGVPGYVISRSGVACCICLSNVRWRSRLRIKLAHVFKKSGVPGYAISRSGGACCICLSNVRWRPPLRRHGGSPGHAGPAIAVAARMRRASKPARTRKPRLTEA